MTSTEPLLPSWFILALLHFKCSTGTATEHSTMPIPELNDYENTSSFNGSAETETRFHTFGVQFFAYVNAQKPDEQTEIRSGDLGSLKMAGLTFGETIKIYAHGFQSQYNFFSQAMDVKNAYLKAGFKNVILINWENSVPVIEDIPIVGLLTYPAAIWKYIPNACKAVVTFVKFLIANGFQADSIHLLGESLGAHLVGCAGNHLKSQYGIVVGRATGLDPAGPLRQITPKENKMNKGSARFVDAMHTSIDGFGTPNPVGHVDFYANGGRGQDQNGCAYSFLPPPISFVVTTACAHSRPQPLWEYAIPADVYLYGYPCSKENATSKPTVCGPPKTYQVKTRVRFGEYIPLTARGKFFLPVSTATISAIKSAGIPLAQV